MNFVIRRDYTQQDVTKLKDVTPATKESSKPKSAEKPAKAKSTKSKG
jgi:hypothetical protein